MIRSPSFESILEEPSISYLRTTQSEGESTRADHENLQPEASGASVKEGKGDESDSLWYGSTSTSHIASPLETSSVLRRSTSQKVLGYLSDLVRSVSSSTSSRDSACDTRSPLESNVAGERSLKGTHAGFSDDRHREDQDEGSSKSDWPPDLLRSMGEGLQAECNQYVLNAWVGGTFTTDGTQLSRSRRVRQLSCVPSEQDPPACRFRLDHQAKQSLRLQYCFSRSEPYPTPIHPNHFLIRVRRFGPSPPARERFIFVRAAYDHQTCRASIKPPS